MRALWYDLSMSTPSAAPLRQPLARTKDSWLALGIFSLLAVLLSWPVIANLSSRIPGTATWAFDESTFTWNLWYFKHALLELGRSPLHTELIWYPLGIDLILYTYNFFNAVIGLPLLVAFSLPTASNLTLLLATTLSGFGAYLLALDLLLHAQGDRSRVQELRLAALIAGGIYAFASNRAIYAALGHYDMVTTQWLPFYALYLFRTLRRPTLRNGALAGFFFALAALAEMIFASFLGLFSLIVLAASWMWLPDRRAVLKALCAAALVAVLIWSPVLVPIAREFIGGNYSLTGWGESVKLSADLAGLVTPTDLNPLFTEHASDMAHWTQTLRSVEEGRARFSDVNTVFLGWATLALALLGMWTARGRTRAWAWTALVFGVLALGPLLQINGSHRFSLDSLLPEGVTIPLPFALLHYVPVVNANRAPNRNSVILMLALAVLAAFGMAWLLSHFRRLTSGGNKADRLWTGGAAVLLTGVVSLAVLLEHLAVPLPTTDARIPDIYAQIGAEAGQFAIMQLPLGWRNSFGVLGSEMTLLQYFQTTHGKPMLGGNISRAPAYKMAYFERIPLFKALTDLEMYRDVPPDVDAAARAQAADLMAFYDVRYLITSPPISGRYPYQDTRQRTEAYALDVLPVEQPAFWEEDGYRAYRIRQPEIAFPLRVDVGAPGAEPYLGGGWDVVTDEQPYGATANWAVDKTADLYLPLSEPADTTLRLSLAPLVYDGAPAQTVAISVNGTRVLEDHALQPGWQTVEAIIPAAATQRGPNRVRLEFAHAASPRQVFPDAVSRAEIGTTGLASPVNIEAHAFEEAYISATDATGATTDASAGQTGYNVAVIHPRTGRIVDVHGFDTVSDPRGADALAAYLRRIRRGYIVAAATKGGGGQLNSAAVEALRGIGSSVVDAAEMTGKAHALVGVMGATPGTVAEEISPTDAFVQVAGDFRTLAAALDWIEIGP
jgi:hypothetical protein